jgi:hypothetical protein
MRQSSLFEFAVYGFDETRLYDKTYQGWRGIQKAFQNGRWVRHPKCRRKSTSRDMIAGVLVALTQNPPAEVRQLQQLLNIVDSTGGLVDL